MKLPKKTIKEAIEWEVGFFAKNLEKQAITETMAVLGLGENDDFTAAEMAYTKKEVEKAFKEIYEKLNVVTKLEQYLNPLGLKATEEK